MKRVHFQAGVIAFLGVALPVLALAQFRGPTTQPPGGNVPGVIWNMASGGTQNGAVINISGTASVNNVNTAQNSANQVFGDNYLQSSKAFRVDQAGAAMYYMGNWGGGGGAAQPLTFTVEGDLYADRVAPYAGSGNEGRMQARKFCFYPGTNPTDCISTWPTGAGLYVLKTGDTMTGNLFINGAYLYANGGAEITPNFKYYDAVGRYFESGGYVAPLNNTFMEMGQSGVPAIKFMTNLNQNIASSVNHVTNPGASAGYFSEGSSGSIQPSSNFSLGSAAGIAASMNTGITTAASAYFGYCPPNTSPCYGMDMEAYNQYVTTYGLQVQTSSGSTAIIGDGTTAGRLTGGSIGLAARTTAAGGTAITATAERYGLNASATGTTGTAVYGNGTQTGGQFTGGTYGVNVSSAGTAGLFTTGDAFGTQAALGKANTGVIASGFIGGQFTGTNTGISVQGTAAGSIGGIFSGGNFGIQSSASAPSGAGGSFTGFTGVNGIGSGAGTTVGVSGSGVIGISANGSDTGITTVGNTYGIQSTGSFGSFFNNTSGYTTYLAYPGYGVYANVPAGNYVFYGVGGNSYVSGNSQIGGNATVNGTASITGNTTISGNITAPNNTLGNCSWNGFVADGNPNICPSTAPIQHGSQRNAANTQTNIYCCDL